MSAQPVIFISAVGSELKSARELCGRLLTSFGYRVTWQDYTSANGDEAISLLRPKLEYVDAVFALVGKQYGPEPKTPPAEFGRVSFAQYEVKFAQSLSRPIFFVRCDRYPPPDPANPPAPEAAEVAALQKEFVAALHSRALLLRTADSPAALEGVLGRLRSELPSLAPKWPMQVAAAIVAVALALGGWWMYAHRAPVVVTNPQDVILLGAVREYPMLDAGLKVEAGLKPKPPGTPLADTQADAYAALAKKLSLDAPTAGALAGYASALQDNAQAPPLDRARGAYTAGHFPEAETLYVAAAQAAQSASPARLAEAVDALELAGWSARQHRDSAKALEHFREAAAQTSQQRDSVQWARIQHGIAFALAELGRAGEVLPPLKKTPSPDGPPPVTNDPVAVTPTGPPSRPERPPTPVQPEKPVVTPPPAAPLVNYAEAEVALRKLLADRERTLGKEHADTLATQNELANALVEQKKFGDAQTVAYASYRACQKAFGDENAATLEAAWQLARALYGQQRMVDAREFARRAAEGAPKVLGPDNPKTKAYQQFYNEIRGTAAIR